MKRKFYSPSLQSVLEPIVTHFRPFLNTKDAACARQCSGFFAHSLPVANFPSLTTHEIAQAIKCCDWAAVLSRLIAQRSRIHRLDCTCSLWVTGAADACYTFECVIDDLKACAKLTYEGILSNDFDDDNDDDDEEDDENDEYSDTVWLMLQRQGSVWIWTLGSTSGLQYEDSIAQRKIEGCGDAQNLLAEILSRFARHAARTHLVEDLKQNTTAFFFTEKGVLTVD